MTSDQSEIDHIAALPHGPAHLLIKDAVHAEAEAARLADATNLGLAAGVWTADPVHAHRRARSGIAPVNTSGGADITVPLGGVRQPGNGHDRSLHALDKYSDPKIAWIEL